ncbi:MAG TPA: HlyD family secretion protein [Thermoanaerobaculia bacterium]|jgi:membrane fusion protein (multidrug efflux system)|nr:HlyD family secretion protein [Thermoanaerobaculia bacterium]
MAQAEVEQQSAPSAARQDERRPAAPQGQPGARERQGQGPEQEAPPAAPAPKKGMPRRFRLLAIVGVAVLAVAAVLYWLHSRHYEDTDDAQVDGHIHPISARVSGTVLAVNPQVEENRYVTAGTVLVTIDPADFQAAADSARAEADRLRASAAASSAEVPVQTANAEGQLHVAEAALAQSGQAVATEIGNLNAAKARAEQAQSNARKTEADRKRYSNLLDKQEISRSEYDQRANDARTAQAAYDAAQADVSAATARVAQARDAVDQQKANLVKARTAPQQIAEVKARSGSANAELARAAAQLETARLNLSYTRIVAPVSGLVGRKSVESGQRVQPGQELVTIVQLDDVWITANFKETQLRLMRPGQPAEIHVDAYGVDLPAHVESIAAATGSRFSLLPPENASGNFVKVVQRLPVRIRLDRQQDALHPLRPGLSVDAKVTVR